MKIFANQIVTFNIRCGRNQSERPSPSVTVYKKLPADQGLSFYLCCGRNPAEKPSLYVMVITVLLMLGFLFISACSMGMKDDFVGMAEREQAKIQSWSSLDQGEPATILGDLISSQNLESLVNEALSANPGLQQTLLALRIQQAQYRQTGAEKLPEITAGYAAEKSEDSNSEYIGSVTVSWEVDLWQKLENDVMAAAKDVAEQQALYQSAQDTLAAEVMMDWIGLTSAQKNITIEGQRLATLKKTEEFIMQRYSSGLGTLEDLDSARSATASSRASLEEYKETLAQKKRALQTLLGRDTVSDFTLDRTEAEQIDFDRTYNEVLVPLVGLPEQTLQQRPDLKAAYLAIEAAALRVKVAYKDLLPSINLQAALEDVASSPGKALLTDPAWSLLGQLTAPLFQGGKLRKEAEIAELETAKSFQVYRETLLNAVQDTEDAIGNERSLGRQQKHIENALGSAQNSLDQYRRKYRQGLVGILDLLTVQSQTYDLKIQLNNLIYERLANRITLGLALGLGVNT